MTFVKKRNHFIGMVAPLLYNRYRRDNLMGEYKPTREEAYAGLVKKVQQQ
jgi:hypothetical protein